jgi:tetratricopeptide (TPR) repeat protein
VIVAKYRAPRPKEDAAAPVPAAGSRAWWPFALLGGALILAGALVVGKPGRSGPPSAPATVGPAAVAAADPVATSPAVDVPPPTLASAPPPPKVAEVLADLSRVPEADLEKARELARRLQSPPSVTAADVQAAEDLLARFPQDESLRRLLASLLMAASEQDRHRRQFASATGRLQRAATVWPNSSQPPLALMNVALEAGEWAAAEAAARAVIALEPRNFQAWKGLGYALLRQDRGRDAADALRTALAIGDDSMTQALLDKVEKGLADEGGMRERQLSHFHVRYDGGEHEAVGREILRALERHYVTLTSTLDHQPAAPVAVILFSSASYYDASGAPAWSGGQYDTTDGRIRIPIGGLTGSLTPDMDGTLIHELTHAFVADRTRGVAPREIHEGLAQFMEGKRLDTMLDRERMAWLADGRLTGTVNGFYLSALSFVEYLMALRGQGGMNDLLRVMGETGSVDEAFRQVHGGTMRATQQAWTSRLQRQYGSD